MVAPMSIYLANYARAAVPRYTSYPPANRFHDGVGAAQYRQWLGSIGPDDTLSLYVHIPFCSALCWYCGCHTTVANSASRVDYYIEALKLEIARVGHCVASLAPVTQVHFGGGTPNLLAPDVLASIIDELGEHFAIDEATEIALEADPRCLTTDHIAMLARYARVRVSLGVQDVSPDVQKLINRIQPFETVRTAVKRLRDAGVTGLNMDLIYGLPGQSVAHVTDSASRCAELEPDRFAVFGYAHVPWFKRHQRAIDETKLPDGPARMDQADAVRATLTGQGYAAIGLDHFAREGDALHSADAEGRLKRNFQGYTCDPADALIGFGASSIGSFNAGYIQNQPHLGKYQAVVTAGELPVMRGIAMTGHDRLTRAIIERLMCDFKVDLAAVAARRPFDFENFAPALSALERLRADGLVEVDGPIIAVTARGRPYVRNIAACFDDGFSQEGQKYSRAV